MIPELTQIPPEDMVIFVITDIILMIIGGIFIYKMWRESE